MNDADTTDPGPSDAGAHRPGAVVVFGSLNHDLTVEVAALPRPGETLAALALREAPGGKGANQAHAAARVAGPGTAVWMVGCVGSDGPGQQMLAELAAAGARTDHVRAVPGPSGTALITLDAAGENTIVVAAGANAAWTPDMVEAAPLAVGDVAVCQYEVPEWVVAAVAERCREVGAHLVLNAAPPHPVTGDVLAAVDTLVVNETEAHTALGTPIHTPQDVTRAAQDAGVDLVVTLGSRGVIGHDREAGDFAVAAHRITPVDTVGAGDAFIGALAVALAEGGDLEAAARLGNAAGAATACVPGARRRDMTRDDLEDHIAH